ncbi:ISBma2-like transposase [Bacillus sp. 1NLA3E]|nr:ISBma2-like transposase [Bacillus sp. 1NLA3E]
MVKPRFKPKKSSQSEYKFLSIDELVPADYLLRLIDKYIDFSFLLEKVLIIAMIMDVPLTLLFFLK